MSHINPKQSKRLSGGSERLTAKVKLHRGRYDLRRVLHSLKPKIHSEVSTTCFAIPFLNVAVLVMAQPITNDLDGITENASLNIC
jgi:hypothetical protein